MALSEAWKSTLKKAALAALVAALTVLLREYPKEAEKLRKKEQS